MKQREFGALTGKSGGTLVARLGALAVTSGAAALAGRRGVDPASDALGFVTTSYLLSLLLYVGFPRLRRDDLVVVASSAFLACALLRVLDGSPAAFSPLLFGALGAGAAWLPGRVERFRSGKRHEDRRRGRRASDLIALDRWVGRAETGTDASKA